ncbi:MAG: hypothetical protein IPL73_10080 [Candidatus Obscuribacter sp.]|nr:hypothetical protein [Candidatus Obscuribacter sp.]
MTKYFGLRLLRIGTKEESSESEVIRQFAVLYAQAGQLRNGFLLLDVANERSLGSKANLDDEVFTRSMILLDRANLKATLLQYKDARSCFDQAFVVLKSLKSSGFKASDPNHAQLVYNKTRQLSALVRTSGDLKSATEMLQLVLDLSKTDWSFINQFRERSDVSNTRGYAAVQLARLLMEQKQYALASKYLTETANDSGTKPPNMLLLVRARCAEAMQDYAAAAKDYASLASNYSPLTSYTDKAIKKGQETYFRLAIDNATKAKSFDPATLAVMRTALDKIIIEQPRTQSISRNVLLSSTLANASFTALVSAANDEIQAANYKKAYEYLKQAIESITVTQVAENIGLPAVGRSIDKFADTGHQEQAEALYVMLVQKIEALCCDKSIECHTALQNLVVFYLRQLNEPRLWPVLERMLAIDQRRCEAGQYYDRVAYKPIDVFVSTKLKPAQCKLALAALSRMLEVSKKLYGDDGRVGKIYSQMATLEISMGDNSTAEEHLKRLLSKICMVWMDLVASIAKYFLICCKNREDKKSAICLRQIGLSAMPCCKSIVSIFMVSKIAIICSQSTMFCREKHHTVPVFALWLWPYLALSKVQVMGQKPLLMRLWPLTPSSIIRLCLPAVVCLCQRQRINALFVSGL